MIERDILPMKMHKNCVIKVLTDHPEDLPKISPAWKGTAAELIEAMKADPHQWIVNGILSE